MKNIVIAAGYATRLGELTKNFPKPLLKIGESTILGRMLDDIDRIPDVDEHIIITNHKFAAIFEQWAEEQSYSKPITIVDDGTETNDTRLGAVCDLLFAMDKLHINDDLLVVAADNLLFFSFQEFVDFAREKQTSCIMCHEQPSIEKLQRTGVVELDANNRVLGMEEKPQVPKSHWAVPPFYFYLKKDLDLVRHAVENGCGKDAPGNLAHYMVDHTAMHAWPMSAGRFDIGSLDTYYEAQRLYGTTEPAANTKKILTTLAFLFISMVVMAVPAKRGVFNTGEAKDIKPQGWLQTLLQRQHDGLTGHPEALCYPYNSCLWAGEISRPDESYGDNWWRYEQTAYYTDGLLKLGYELGDEAMVAKAMEGIEYTLAHPDANGVLGNSTLVGITWPMSVFFRVLQAKYEHDGDERIPAALEKHYLNFTPEDLAGGIVGGRNIMSLEGILWTYGKTGNEKLLQLAEDAWAIQDKFAVDETAITSDEPFYMHSVTFSEMLKLPLLLYAYTGKQHYLELAEKAFNKVQRESMLPDGVPSSAEFLLGSSIGNSHETCVIVDYTWTLMQYLQVTGQAFWADWIERAIYNAGLGAITKDFRSLQYFSSVNQFIATGTSNHNIYKHGSTWMAYRPTHETECCSGNVNRMLPNFVSRMWMTDAEGGAVATIYGPSQATFPTEKGDITITCETNYPFAETLTFKVSGAEGATIPLTLRIPLSCNSASLAVNDSPVDIPLPVGTFVKLPKSVKDGDIVMLTLQMTTNKAEWLDEGVFFLRGPLLFAYAIPQQMTEDTEEYANMHGKKPENPDFKCWNITPTGDFNYAYTDDGQEISVNYPAIEEIGGTIPFDLNYTPVNLRIPVKQFEWNLVDNRYTPAQPEQGRLNLLSDEIKYIDLVPYGCTELRLTVFPDADAKPLPDPEEPDYSRPDDAPDCVEALDGIYYAYFEEPRFCWDEPIYCKVSTEDGTWPMATPTAIDLHSSQDGDLCEIVGTTDNGRKIWRWTGPELSNPAPTDIIFTNHDLLTDIMPFANGGYYKYDGLHYQAGPSVPTGIFSMSKQGDASRLSPLTSTWITIDGTSLMRRPTTKGVYIYNGKKYVIK